MKKVIIKLKHIFILIKYWFTIKANLKYKFWYFLAFFKKIYFVMIWKANYCYSYFPFQWDFVIENKYGKYLVNEPWDMSPIISTYFEANLVEEFLSTNKWTFIDIWANIWKYSIILWKKWFKCFSIEPNTLLHKYINKNIYLNNLNKNITLIPFWVDTDNKKLTLKIPWWDNYWSWSLVNDYENYIENNIELKHFSNLVNEYSINISDIRLIKIDVEWYEKNVINSMKEYLKEFKNTKIIIEMFDEKWNVGYIKDLLLMNWFIFQKKVAWDNFIFYKK